MHRVLISVSLLLLIDIRAASSNNCGDPPSIDNAAVNDVTNNPDPDVYSVGTRVTYVCQFGYVANGRGRSIKCEQNGGMVQWTVPQFSCTPQSCGDPGHIDNGRREGSLFTFPNAVNYNCDSGYVLQGVKTRYCQTNGLWSNRLPTCQIISCDPPDPPENGQVFATSYEYGSELRYKCDPGFKLNTDETVYCTEDRTWSQKNVACVENLCEEPIPPAHGKVTISGANNRPRAGSIAIFTCDEGRIPSGSTSSKCMENGNWVFPPPECLEPCTVPVIPNGVILKTVKRYYRDYSEEVKVGTQVNEDDVLHLKCSDGYEAASSKNQKTKVTCREGKWSEKICKPASCNSQPPSAQNAYVQVNNREHGGTASYRCYHDFRKVRNELMKCDHGKWFGLLPECISTSCKATTLSFNKGFVVRGRKETYKDGEVYQTICDKGYDMKEGHKGFKCENGIWAGDLPPCVARGCNEPPGIENGKANYYSTSHSATVTYECENSYILMGDKTMQCLLGEWKDQPPYCKDNRCYLNNLKYKQHVSSETQTETFSGEKLNVLCEDGYSARTAPVCNNGEWSSDYQPFCEESGCVVPTLYHGSMGYREYGDWYFNWREFRYVRSVIFITVPKGTIVTAGSSLTLKCNHPYFVHGNGGYNEGEMSCREGKWENDPVCLSYGQKYIPTTAKPRTTLATPYHTSSTTAINPVTPVTPIRESVNLTTQVNENKDNDTELNIMVFTSTEPPKEECFCEYPLSDSKVVAQVDGIRLKYGDKVKNGSTIVFRCLHVGFHIFSGRREINCSNCQRWHSSDFPSCSDPSKGNAVIILETNPEVLPDGTVQLLKGQSANFTCVAMEIGEYPDWNAPELPNMLYNEERRDREEYGDVLYTTCLFINNADYVNEGTYECSVKGNPKTAINIIVTDPNLRCPEIEEGDEIIIKYDKERRERSKVHFSCPPKRELIGKSELTCLNTGEWSDSKPHCSGIRCEELKGTDLLKIQYTHQRTVGSLASFHCFAPGKRHGVSSTKCLENGSWADPTPFCGIIKCKPLEETDYLTIQYQGDRDVDSTATFHCFSPAKRSGVSFTKCLANGSWEHPTPTCTVPPCSTNDLLSSVLPDAEPLINKGNNDTFPYKSTVKLICKNDKISVGNPIAICEKDGKWNITSIQCESGCRPPTKSLDANIKMNPEKNMYKIGDKVTLSCPYGMNLSRGPQLIMCLINGWSPNNIPSCIENKNTDTKVSQNKDTLD